jgi:hypothetical protein
VSGVTCDHDFQPCGFYDGCHEYGTLTRCSKCGEYGKHQGGERNGEGYSILMMNPEECPRCREILEKNGHATPAPEVSVNLFGVEDTVPSYPPVHVDEPELEEEYA